MKVHHFGISPVSPERLKAVYEAALNQTPDHLCVTVILIPFGDDERKSGACLASSGEVTPTMFRQAADSMEESEQT